MKPEDLSRHSAAKPDRYHRWSDEDQCYIGYCHGDQEEQTYADLCAIVRDEIAHRLTMTEGYDRGTGL